MESNHCERFMLNPTVPADHIKSKKVMTVFASVDISAICCSCRSIIIILSIFAVVDV